MNADFIVLDKIAYKTSDFLIALKERCQKCIKKRICLNKRNPSRKTFENK